MQNVFFLTLSVTLLKKARFNDFTSVGLFVFIKKQSIHFRMFNYWIYVCFMTLLIFIGLRRYDSIFFY